MRQRRRHCFYQSHAGGTLHRGNLEEACLAWLRQRPDDTGHNDDVDEFAHELEQLGADPEKLERFKAASYADEDEEIAEADEDEFYVYPVNSDAVRVFIACRWQRTVLAGPAGAMQLYDSIDATEVRAVCEMLRIPAERWETVLAGVRIMEPVLRDELNPD